MSADNNILGEIMFQSESDSVDKPTNSFRVHWLDIATLIYAIVFHFVDSGFDLYLAYSYFISGELSHFAWTIAFTLIPTVIISCISIRMYIEDAKDSLINWKTLLRPSLCIIGLVIQLSIVIRYFDSLLFAKKCLKAEAKGNKRLQESYYRKMLKEDSDVALLRVFECYLESACQQLLQITLLVIDYSQGSQVHLVKQCIMITLSFMSMGWCMATYHRCIRFDRDDKENISKLGTLAQFLWHLNLTVSRIFALGAVAILYPFWAIIAVACHWCGMTIWVAVTAKTNFCGKSLIFEVFFSGTVALIYIFNFISLKDGPTRKSYIVFFVICFVENIVASVIWGIKSQSIIKNWTYYVFLILPVAALFVSAVFLVLYYSLLHPTKPPFCQKGHKVFYGSHLNNVINEQEFSLNDEQGNKNYVCT